MPATAPSAGWVAAMGSAYGASYHVGAGHARDCPDRRLGRSHGQLLPRQ